MTFICALALALPCSVTAEEQPLSLSVAFHPPLCLALLTAPGCSSCPQKNSSLLSSFHLLHVDLLILQECKYARTDPGEREGIFPCYPVFPLYTLCHFRFFLIPPSLHPAPPTPFPAFLLSFSDFCFSHSEILYRKPQLDSANSERSILKALKGLIVEGNFLFWRVV